VGWPTFFIIAIVACWPALLLLLRLKPQVQALERPAP